MPVVLTTPVPHVPTRPSRNAAAWLQIARERLPEAKEWSKKTLKDAPRTLLISAPFIALLGIWAAHGLVTRSHSHTAQAVASPPANAAPTQTTTATALVAPPPVPATAAPSVTPEPATTPTAEAAALEQAQQHGLPALEKLSGQFPADARVSVALANEQARAQRFEAAVGTLDALLTHTPNTDQNGKVMGILWRAAQSAASEPAFVTLRKLGGRGSDVAFDLATTPGVRAAVRERAKTELTQHLASDASDDTRVATALLLAPDCSTRKSLLERADHEGGKRTRTLLEQFSRGAGCTSSSDGACNSCLMSSPVLAHALEHLSAGAKP